MSFSILVYPHSSEKELPKNLKQIKHKAETAKIITQDLAPTYKIEFSEPCFYNLIEKKNQPSFIRNANDFYIIFSNENQMPAGFADIKIEENHVFIEGLYTDPMYQRKGIGKKALEVIANIAKDIKISSIQLALLDNEVVNSRDFYEKYGFDDPDIEGYFHISTDLLLEKTSADSCKNQPSAISLTR